MIGTRVGHFEITAKLGEGGMGEVYRARDTKLGRDVAVKVLPRTLTADPERVARFEREARLLATLNHPNIAQIYGVESRGANQALVMELVEGPTLAERLQRGPIPLEEALGIARQIAVALEEAHEKGIVHRDLKPANVKLTPAGRVKVLDFGLAKALEIGQPLTDSEIADSPTLSAATVQGVLLGTAAYMSPEQAKGKGADRRSDVWAFATVLWEMLAGRRLFGAESVTETLAGVLGAEIPLNELPPETPPAIRRLLGRCLRRDPKNRLHDIADARIVLDEVLAGEVPPEEVQPVAARGRLRLPAPGAAALIALVAVLAFGLGWALSRPSPSPPPLIGDDTLVRKITFAPGLEAEPSFSPDGNSIAYTTNDRGSLDIAILPLAGGELRRLVGAEGDEAHPAWSPDGGRIAFTAARDGGHLTAIGNLSALTPFVQGQGGDIHVVPAAGGRPARLVDRGSFPAWSADGGQVAFQSDRSGSWDIWRVPSQGGQPVAVTSDAEIDFQPAWSPDGRWIAFASSGGLRVAAADGEGPPRRLVAAPLQVLSPSWSADGRWIYFSWNRSMTTPSLWRVAFGSADEGGRGSQPERVSLGGSGGDVTISSSGRRLAWSEAQYAPDLYELDLESGELRQLTATSCPEDAPHLAPDGRTLLFMSSCGSDISRLWTLDLSSGDREPVTPPGVAAIFGRWSPDGRSIAYVQVDELQARKLVVRPRSGLSARELLAGDQAAPDWSPDGDHLAAGEGSVIALVSLDGERRDLATVSAGELAFPAFAGDGRTVVYQLEAEGKPRQLWAVPLDGGTPRPVTDSALEHSHPQGHRAHPGEILIVVDHQDLGLVSLATGELERLTDIADSTVLVDYPTWSPDGGKVYFSLTRKIGDLFLLENPSPAGRAE